MCNDEMLRGGKPEAHRRCARGFLHLGELRAAKGVLSKGKRSKKSISRATGPRDRSSDPTYLGLNI